MKGFLQREWKKKVGGQVSNITTGECYCGDNIRTCFNNAPDAMAISEIPF